MTVTGQELDNVELDARYRLDENGQLRLFRHFKVFAGSRELALTWPELPLRGSPYAEGSAALAQTYEIQRAGGDQFVITVGYSSAITASPPSEPTLTPGLTFSRFSLEEGTISVESDVEGEPISDRGAQVIVRYPIVEVVQHRTTPLDPRAILGVVPVGQGAAARLSNFAVTNGVPTPMPAFEWDAVGSQTSGVVFAIGELLYQRTTQEYRGDGQFVYTHFMRASPDHKHYWFATEDGERVEKSATIYPAGNLAALWAN